VAIVKLITVVGKVFEISVIEAYLLEMTLFKPYLAEVRQGEIQALELYPRDPLALTEWESP
jgi:hypothetical protein